MSLTNDEWRELELLRQTVTKLGERRTEDYEQGATRHAALMAELAEIKEEVRRTNGRVTRLENVAQIGAVIQRAVYAIALVFAGAVATALAQRMLGGG